MPLKDPHARQLAARAGAAVRNGRDATDLRRELAEARIAQYVTRVVASAPPLQPEQVARLTTLLRPSPTAGEAA